MLLRIVTEISQVVTLKLKFYIKFLRVGVRERRKLLRGQGI